MRKPWQPNGRIYILPTGFGLVFLSGSMLMILVGATFQNNLVNLLAFFMLSLVFVSMVQTNMNLRDVDLETLEINSNYVGRDLVAYVMLKNSGKEPRFNLEFGFKKLKSRAEYDQVQPLLPKGTLRLKAAYDAETRGHYSVDRVKIHTDYPLGLFRSWKWIDCATEYYVYPEPRHSSLQSKESDGENIQSRRPQKGGHDFSGHRRYQTGDPMARVDWKAHARGRRWLLKEFDEGSPNALCFDWSATETLPHEDRLSQMAAWIENAESQKTPYAVTLPGFASQSDLGVRHAHRILKMLATLDDRKKDESHAA